MGNRDFASRLCHSMQPIPFSVPRTRAPVSLSEVDRELLQRCLDRAPQSWQKFVDRFIGLVVHVTHHTAASRNFTIDSSTCDDLVAEVFLTLVDNDFATLRRFRRHCSLATYLTVIARRVVVRRLVNGAKQPLSSSELNPAAPDDDDLQDLRRQEIEQLMTQLEPQEQIAIRMFHLEGKSYREIGQTLGLGENSVGPMLSRAKAKMREREARA